MNVQQHLKAGLKAGGLSNRQAMAVIWIAKAHAECGSLASRWWSREYDPAAAWVITLAAHVERLAATYREAFLSKQS